jgi:hypothetical protein
MKTWWNRNVTVTALALPLEEGKLRHLPQCKLDGLYDSLAALDVGQAHNFYNPKLSAEIWWDSDSPGNDWRALDKTIFSLQISKSCGKEPS